MFPQLTALAEPLFGARNRVGGDSACAGSSRLLGDNEAARFQHLHVLVNGCERRPIRPCQFAHRRRTLRQAFKNPPPRRIGERVKRLVQLIGMLKHALKYQAANQDSSTFLSVVPAKKAAE